MEPSFVSRALAAARALAGELGLPVEHAVVAHNSNKLALRLLPCDVLVRLSRTGPDPAEFEVELAQRLAVTAGPVAALDPRVDPRAYERDGFTMTWWTYYEPVAPEVDSAAYAAALISLHVGMREVGMDVPHFSDRAASALRLVTSPARTPALAPADRRLLTNTLQDASERIRRRGAAEQLLHGEPHPGNLLSTHRGPVFIDLETCCRGPVEFDVAHVPHGVSLHYPDVDHALLADCRQLVLAMVAAWRWDRDDEFPDGSRHGRDLLTMLRDGPPWPPIGELTKD